MPRINAFIKETCMQANQAYLISKPSNIFYLSGYKGEGYLLSLAERSYIITDSRYEEQAQLEAPDCETVCIRTGVSHFDLAKDIILSHHITAVYVEADGLTMREHDALRALLPDDVSISAMDGQPERMRQIKDEGEIRLIETACHVSCLAFEHIIGYIKAGMTEKQVQLELDYYMYRNGADKLAFDTIIASGAHGSLPHAVPGDNVIKNGDMVTMDFGAKVGGYCADMTRTVAVGKPSDEMKAVYDTVLQAHLMAEQALCAGASCPAVDSIARDYIDEAGYKGRFGHGLGHSLGVDIHEEPRLSPASRAVLRSGMLMTVEPGIYLPGIGGVRIEDTCLVTENGYRSLIGVQKELLVL
ncbi:MAG: aminopeptidase P family protein [Eubacteriales bacterium]|nr:aminopeptidase P family protein [Eubacteriales bacterium]MDD3881685.1 aminopeptidase P family protein [Eubacteriales bacterium]MDD4512256.1 aminopeptidase P family protein [Eubacteriales bacterium]